MNPIHLVVEDTAGRSESTTISGDPDQTVSLLFGTFDKLMTGETSFAHSLYMHNRMSSLSYQCSAVEAIALYVVNHLGLNEMAIMLNGIDYKFEEEQIDAFLQRASLTFQWPHEFTELEKHKTDRRRPLVLIATAFPANERDETLTAVAEAMARAYFADWSSSAGLFVGPE